MRLTLLAFIFLLMLTLGNAILMRNERASMVSRSFDPVQLPQRRAAHYEWDAFIWREIAAVTVTVVVFGGIQALAGSSAHDRK